MKTITSKRLTSIQGATIRIKGTAKILTDQYLDYVTIHNDERITARAKINGKVVHVNLIKKVEETKRKTIHGEVPHTRRLTSYWELQA
jgi:hypothetical protein